MDYFFMSSLTQNVPSRLVVSYDIVCLWARNLLSRSSLYPPNMIPFLEFVYLVPKFHLPAHVPICQVNYSFNFTPLVGRTDGEAPERGWAAMNAVANSTKEMGPGSRRDTLDDHFGDYNWRKITAMGMFFIYDFVVISFITPLIAETFLRKMTEAVDERTKHVVAFEAFDSSLPVEETAEWTRLVQTWEKDSTRPNPFESKLRG